MLTDSLIRQKPVATDEDGNPRAKKFGDKDGMYLVVSETGGKFFRWKYRYGGKEKALSLGQYPTVTLKAAREKVAQAKRLLDAGLDPAAVKQQVKREAKYAQDNNFKACAEDWHKERQGQIAHETWMKERGILDTWLYPWIGQRPMGEIDPPELLEVIRRVQRHSLETAHRALAMVKFIYRLGIVTGRAARNPALDLTGMLPSTKTVHHAAVINPEAFGALLVKIDASKATFPVACALKLLPLLFCRPGELRAMRWSEVDLERAEWTYFVTKTEVEHRVPLSKQAVSILKELKPLTGQYERVFVTRQCGSAISDNTLNSALRAVGVDTKSEHTGHGFRASARTMLAERLNVPPHIIEHQLSHSVPDALGRAYNRALYMDERRDMMQRWADYCDELKRSAIDSKANLTGSHSEP
jgi:integrase